MRRPARALVTILIAAAAVWLVRPSVLGLFFIVRAAGVNGIARHVADLDVVGFRESLITIPLRSASPIRARLFQPSHPRRTALLVSGLHPAGIDEPRLVALARELAAANLAVVTPEIPELSEFAITPSVTGAIEESVDWLSASALAPAGTVGLMGISFSGGLSIVAAGRPSIARKVAFVFSLGGHDDLPRVLRYLCTGIEVLPPHQVALGPDSNGQFTRTPHDYGLAVVLLGVADRLVPPSQVEPLRAAVRRFLWASHLDTVDRPKAEKEFEAVRGLTAQLPQPSATLMRYVNERDVVHLGARLLPFVAGYGAAPALSPSKSPKPTAPVFVLHGTADNVIPPVEAEYLADDLWDPLESTCRHASLSIL